LQREAIKVICIPADFNMELFACRPTEDLRFKSLSTRSWIARIPSIHAHAQQTPDRSKANHLKPQWLLTSG
jgi:hypothetical protein